MEGMRKINFGIYMSLLITLLRVINMIDATLCIKGLIVVVITVITGNVAEHAKDLIGMFKFKEKPKTNKLP
jgi:hypothetical protein